MGGQDAEQFWRFTPRLFRLWMEARLKARKYDHQANAWLAWHTAALPLMKKFPALEDLMGVKRKARQQTASEMEAILKAWAARK